MTQPDPGTPTPATNSVITPRLSLSEIVERLWEVSSPPTPDPEPPVSDWSLHLRPRAASAATRAKCGTVDDIKRFGPINFLKMSNVGRSTCAELGAFVGEDWCLNECFVPPEPLKPKKEKRGHDRLKGSRDPGRDNRIMARLSGGTISMEAVGKEFGITRERVRQIVQRRFGHTARTLGYFEHLGTKRRERLKVLQEKRECKARARADFIAVLKDMREAGMKQWQIAEACGMSHTSVTHYLLGAGCRSVVRKNSPPYAVATTKPVHDKKRLRLIGQKER